MKLWYQTTWAGGMMQIAEGSEEEMSAKLESRVKRDTKRYIRGYPGADQTKVEPAMRRAYKLQ